MLTLENLRMRLGSFTLEADFNVGSGAHIAVIGPSGGGKSTLLAAIAGFVTPESGRILWQGNDMTALPPAERPVTMIFQDNNLFPHLSAAQNVGLGLRPDLRLDAGEKTRVEQVLERVGLGGHGEKRPAALSGGQIARVALARALLRARPLMLLDEPFAALGPAQKADMLRLVTDLADESGATVLMVSHDPQDARAFAQEVVLVADGQAHAPVETGALFDAPPEALRVYLGV